MRVVDEIMVDLIGVSSSEEGATPIDTPGPSDSTSRHEGEESDGGEEESNREERR